MSSNVEWNALAIEMAKQCGGGRNVRYLWPLRVPLVSGALLLAWPWIAFSDGARPYLSGLFDPVDPRAIILITVLALLNAWAVLIIFCLVVHYGERRLGLPGRSCEVPPDFWWWVRVCVLAAPVILTTAWRVGSTQEVSMTAAFLYALGGAGAAIIVVGIAFSIQWTLREVTSGSWWTTNITQLDAIRVGHQLLLMTFRKFPALGDGFLTAPERDKFDKGHAQAFGLAAASVLAYVMTGDLTADIRRPIVASALAYVLLLQLMLTWLAGIAAFVLDRARAPLFVYAVMFMAAVNWFIHPIWSTDHVYRTSVLPPAGTVPDRIAPAELLGGQALSIVVAASGGGIQSAAWTARVLTGIEDKIPGFRSRVRLISAVSGGSVGAMNVLASWSDCGPPLTREEAALPRFDANAASRESSLHAVGWGLVFKDLPRTVMPYFSSPEIDRGSVLEDAWKREPRLQRPFPDDSNAVWEGPPLSWWRTNVAEHRCPAVVFNAMVAETGEPMLFATADLPRSLSAFDFYKHYPGRDLPMTTAARLSAGFPYVSPASRADADTNRYSHVVDGGYFDNYGVVSLARIIHEALKSKPLDPQLRRVLVIEICDTPECSGRESNGTVTAGGPKDRSWTYQLSAPLSAVMQMRTSAQRVNNREALRLLKDYWRTQGACIESIEASFDGTGAPMSWHLTADEKREVDDQWASESHAVVPAVDAFLRRGTQVGKAGLTSADCEP